ncbi:unnamed protein product [Hymenolepis diminuta]|uniref:Uncharacterized protein n=1 Tax=Hymenolepis diminuta TaxID=6216 RepID=A0A564Y701_HYMDI|nr:unnamed protein product [Hymenolepis diminuta]
MNKPFNILVTYNGIHASRPENDRSESSRYKTPSIVRITLPPRIIEKPKDAGNTYVNSIDLRSHNAVDLAKAKALPNTSHQKIQSSLVFLSNKEAELFHSRRSVKPDNIRIRISVPINEFRISRTKSVRLFQVEHPRLTDLQQIRFRNETSWNRIIVQEGQKSGSNLSIARRSEFKSENETSELVFFEKTKSETSSTSVNDTYIMVNIFIIMYGQVKERTVVINDRT